MATLISHGTLACLVAFLAFTLCLLAAAQVPRVVARALQRRCVGPRQRGRRAPSVHLRHAFHKSDACESGTAPSVVFAHACKAGLQERTSVHGKERTP